MRSLYHSYRLDFLLFMRNWGVGFLASVSSFYLLYLSQPPGDFPEAAYFFLSPLLIWFYFKPDKKVLWLALLLGGFLYHVFLIGWIRHVTYPGMVFASIILTLYNSPWFLLAHRWLQIAVNQPFVVRLLLLLGLSSFWVLIEWVRSLFSLGFPWCPLSVTQWERPAILQLVPFFGGWIVSFFLIFFNLCLASYLHHLLVRRRNSPRNGYFSSLCPEFYICMAFFLAMLSPLIFRSIKQDFHHAQKIKIGVCQPYLKNKWSPENISDHKRTLVEQTKLLAAMKPDLIVWPEASTPYPVNLDRGWVESLSKDIDIPILAGAIVREEDFSYNSVVMISPEKGLEPEWYAKRTLVPFGEYVPLPFSFIPGLSRMVGPVGNFTSGKTVHSFNAKDENNGSISIFPLICYEDIFPGLVRGINTDMNALLFVTTNDAWFGEEGCAEQHAAHSIIRALETGFPVLRCGNAGWSGWISPNGIVRETLLNEEQSVYFRGASVLELEVTKGIKTFYAKNGDYFIAFCSIFVISSVLILRKNQKQTTSSK